MARGEDTGNHPNRQVSRVTGPGLQGHSIDPRLGALEQRLIAAQAEPDVPAARNRLDTRYGTLGDFTSRHGRTEERALSLNTYRSANLRRSITADPISRRKTMRQKTGGELAGY